jgi:hypothetical protein
MESVTIAIAVGICILVICLRPVGAFAVFVVSMLTYPNYLGIEVGDLHISLSRIVVTVLLCRCLSNARLMRGFKWSRLDTWVISSITLSFLVPFLTREASILKTLENRSGTIVMDLYFPYLVARFCITNWSDLITFVKFVGIAFIPLAVLAPIESVTGWQPFISLEKYRPWVLPGTGELKPPRFGLTRALGPFSHPTLYGVTFAILLPLYYSLRHEGGRWRTLSYLLCAIAALAILSTLSSGPCIALIAIVVGLVMEHYKYLVKPLAAFILASSVGIGFVSNRPFYHVLYTRLNPFGGTGWHRAKLVDLAIEHFGEWWLLGYGGNDPGWGPALGNRWTDITNHYIIIGCTTGVLGLIVFCGMLVHAIRRLCRAHNTTKGNVLKSWSWALGVVLVAMMITFTGETIFDQTKSLFYSFLGLVGSFSGIVITAAGVTEPKQLVKNAGVLIVR